MSYLNSGPSGFHNAPVSKVLLLTSVGVTVAYSLLASSKLGVKWAAPSLSATGQGFPSLGRVLLQPFMFTSAGELLFGASLLYLFRMFERHWGSHKYLVFVVFSTLCTFFLQLGFSALLPKSFRSVHMGPYGLIFASLVQYITDIPPTKEFKVSIFKLSEKFFVYLLAVQLTFANLPLSLLAAMCGFITGCIYRADVFRIKQVKFPAFLAKFAVNNLLPLIQGTSRPINRNARPLGNPNNADANLNDDQHGHAQQLIGGNNVQQMHQFLPAFNQMQQQQQQQQPQTHNQPSEQNIEALLQMGFGRDEAVSALRRANNNLEGATNILLS